MATISTTDSVFTVGYQALGPDGKQGLFESCFQPGGEAVFEHRHDSRSLSERYRERPTGTRQHPTPQAFAGIYRTAQFPGLLVFVDKSEAEDRIFLNWRGIYSNKYERVEVGIPHFRTDCPTPCLCMSEILFHNGVLSLAWMRPIASAHELVFSRVSVDSPHDRIDEVLELALPSETKVSADHIGSQGIVVAHYGVGDTGDSRIVVRFTPLDLGG